MWEKLLNESATASQLLLNVNGDYISALYQYILPSIKVNFVIYVTTDMGEREDKTWLARTLHRGVLS